LYPLFATGGKLATSIHSTSGTRGKLLYTAGVVDTNGALENLRKFLKKSK
jgi:hypothetical protein